MNFFKWLLLSSAVVSTGANAEISHLSQSTINDEDLGDVVVIRKNNPLIKETALATYAAYNAKDDIAKKMSPLSQQVGYAAREELSKDHKIVSFGATDPQRGAVDAGIVTYRENDSGKVQIMVAYHGSECVEDFTEANFLLHSRQNPELGIHGKIHGGFYDRYMQSRPAMMNAIQKQLADHGKEIQDVDLIVTGHSLGAALATIAAADLKKNVAETARVDLVTYSSPRVVNSNGAKSIEELLGSDRIIRVWRDKDAVPMALLGILGYKHVGQSVKLKATVDKIDLENHSIDTIKADAVSNADIEFDSNHIGYRTWAKNKVSNGIQKIGSGLRKLGSFFSRS